MNRSLLLVPLVVAGLAAFSAPASADPVDDVLHSLAPSVKPATLPYVCVDASPDDPIVSGNLLDGEVQINPNAGPYVYLSDGPCGH